MSMVSGTLDEVERETRAVLAAQRDEIRDGVLAGKYWFIALLEQADAILRRRRAADRRRDARI